MMFFARRPSPQRQAEEMLILATFFWGWTFSVVKDAITLLPVFAFLTLRFALAAGLMASWRLAQPAAATGDGGGAAAQPAGGRWRRFGEQLRASGGVGVVLGVLLFLSFALQTLGLSYTTAAKCAFITGLNVVWVACFAARHWQTWLAVALAVVSLWLMTGGDSAPLNVGDFLSLLCSLFFAAHILLLARLPKTADSGMLSIVQFGVVAALSLAASTIWEDRLLPPEWTLNFVLALVVTVLGATVFSFWVQTHYQKFTTPTRTAIIFILEPVFAALIAIIWYDEALSATSGIGAALILLAMWLTTQDRRRS